jgi:uncharacterized protein YdhG (YjbR/CyaY superfamily)
MPMGNKPPATVDAYINRFPEDVRRILKRMRQTIRTAAPAAVESISYQMPAYKLHGKPLVYFAGWKSHIGFYPIPSGVETFEEELSRYNRAKGSVQFPLDRPIPYALVRKIVRFRAREIQGVRMPASAGRRRA